MTSIASIWERIDEPADEHAAYLAYDSAMTDLSPAAATEPTTPAIAAGEFGAWLKTIRHALASRSGMKVPCGECVGCCTSHYAILLRPHDSALDVVPAALQSSVPGLWYPHVQMKPRADGTCPMFTSGRCSIYAQRPQTCLDYDCRVFTAAKLTAGIDKPVINTRIAAWQFEYADADARAAHQAISDAAAFISARQSDFPNQWAPGTPSGIAVLAIKVYALFLVPMRSSHSPDLINEIMRVAREFDAASRT